MQNNKLSLTETYLDIIRESKKDMYDTPKDPKELIDLLSKGVNLKPFTKNDQMGYSGVESDTPMIDHEACGGICTVILDGNNLHIYSGDDDSLDVMFEITKINTK
jgi:hypothetical protein